MLGHMLTVYLDQVTYIPPILDGIRYLTGMILITVIPGYLLQTRFIPGVKGWDRVVLMLLLSLSFAIGIGLLLHVFHPYIIPYNTVVLNSAYLISVLVLLFLTLRSNSYLTLRYIKLSITDVKVYTFLVCTLLFSVASAHLLRKNWINEGIVALVFLIILGTVLFTSSRFNTHHRISFVFFVALCLLLQSNISNFALGVGDSEKEFFLVQSTISNGFWEHSIEDSKNSVVNLIILFPVIVKVTGIDLMMVFKIVYPLIFSLLPVVLYNIYYKQFDETLAFHAALLFIFLHPFYDVFSLNTRTGFSLLFVALFIWISFYSDSIGMAKIFQLIALILVVMSYYAVAPIFLMFLMVVLLLYHFDSKVSELTSVSVSSYNLKPIVNSAILFSVAIFAWYVYTTASATFESVVTFVLFNVIGNLRDLTLGEGSSAGNAVSQNISLTFELISYQYIIITILMLITFIVFAINRYGSIINISPITTTEVRSEYFYFSVGSGFVILSGLVPTSAFGIARLYTVATIMLAPFALYPLYVSDEIHYGSWSKNHTKALTLAFIILIFSISIGLIGIAYGDNRIPQQHINNPEGTHSQTLDYYGSEWTINHDRSGLLMGSGHSDRIMSHYFYDEYESGLPGDYRTIQEDRRGPVYLSTRSVEAGDVTRSIFYTTGEIPETEYRSYQDVNLSSAHVIYTNGGSEVRYKP